LRIPAENLPLCPFVEVGGFTFASIARAFSTHKCQTLRPVKRSALPIIAKVLECCVAWRGVDGTKPQCWTQTAGQQFDCGWWFCSEGNEYFKARDYPRAIAAYTEAVNAQPDNHVLYSNRRFVAP
jgi:hypothetical protein